MRRRSTMPRIYFLVYSFFITLLANSTVWAASVNDTSTLAQYHQAEKYLTQLVHKSSSITCPRMRIVLSCGDGTSELMSKVVYLSTENLKRPC